ncbi:MAG TPA: BtrH N-terminal domain-containing protein [Jatrophihabitans sp.]|uniref:BtrH N-terminal domain-containing protein n=1 Tax=Jatrophihabitans sp. TaxID=1932789 RepID=UPI002EE59190
MSAAGARAGATRSAQAVRRPPSWYRDTAGCLQASLGSALLAGGWDPLEVLGAGWSFAHLPADDPHEEFYLPLPPGLGLGQALAPHHRLELGWSKARHAGRVALDELVEVLAHGGLPIAAVDNYHLPFRPAYSDVHAAHLVIVYAVDGYRRLVWVADPTPPAFSGSIRIDDFLAAWQSSNPADEQDAFFSQTAINGRYLTLGPLGAAQPLSPRRLADAMRADHLRFQHPGGPADGPAWLGLAGVRRYLSALDDAAAAGDREALRRVYPGTWSVQSSASLHGELLRARGARWRLPELIEFGRAVEQVAHAWTPVRVTAAHHWQDAKPVAELLHAQGRRLQARYQSALALAPAAWRRLAEFAEAAGEPASPECPAEAAAGTDGARHGR